MKIGILGAGHIGGTIGKKWAGAGHNVCFGVRDPQKPEVQDLVKSLGGHAFATLIAEAIDFGEVVLLAVPGGIVDETISANAKRLDGKIIIDAANKMGGAVNNSFSTLATQTPRASIYRAFNSYPWENFEDPVFNNVPADHFFCGTDGESRAKVETLIKDVGLHPLYVGGTDKVEIVDSVLRLWFTLSQGQKMGRHFAFKVLKG